MMERRRGRCRLLRLTTTTPEQTGLERFHHRVDDALAGLWRDLGALAESGHPAAPALVRSLRRLAAEADALKARTLALAHLTGEAGFRAPTGPKPT